MKTMGITKARENFTHLVTEAAQECPVVLTSLKVPKAVLISYNAWVRLNDQVDDLEDLVTYVNRRNESSTPFERFVKDHAIEGEDAT